MSTVERFPLALTVVSGMHSRIRFTVYGDILWSEWRFKDKSHRVWLRPRGVHSFTQAATAVDDDFTLARNGTTEVGRTMSMADQGVYQVGLNKDNGCLLLHSGKYDDAYTSMGTFETVRSGPFNRVVMLLLLLLLTSFGTGRGRYFNR